MKKYYGKGGSCQSPGRRGPGDQAGKFTRHHRHVSSGKSTTFKYAGRAGHPTEEQESVSEAQSLQAHPARGHRLQKKTDPGFIFPERYNLVPVLSVWENIILPISLDGRKPDKKFISRLSNSWEAGKETGQSPRPVRRTATEVAIARSSWQQASIILADEAHGSWFRTRR